MSERAPDGFLLPVNDHLGNELVASNGGTLNFELAHTGYHAITATQRDTVPDFDEMILHALPKRYRQELGSRFDGLLTAPPATPLELLGGAADQYQSITCGRFSLIHRKPP